MSRKLAREAAMKLIYQMDVALAEPDEVLKFYFEDTGEKISADNRRYITECVKGVKGNIDILNGYIEKYSRSWKIDRISKVDIAILRLSIYEMLKVEDVPGAVSINEAVEIAKKYSGDNSPSFINGVLDSVFKEIGDE